MGTIPFLGRQNLNSTSFSGIQHSVSVALALYKGLRNLKNSEYNKSQVDGQ